MRASGLSIAAIALLLLQGGPADARRPRRAQPPPQPAPQAPSQQPTESAPLQTEPQAGARNSASQAGQNGQPQAGGPPPAANFELYPPPGRNVMQTPVSGLFPGNAPARQPATNPVGQNPAAIQRGMSYFTTFNCVGCHAPNGGGGMGPALSNRFFIYGSDPANIYLSIFQGRPNGMPTWGATLPESIIWDLVAYIQSISQAPTSEWGKTASHDAWKSEQLPAEFSQTTTPWSQTERFSFGQSPTGRR